MHKALQILYTEHELLVDVLGFIPETDKLISIDRLRYIYTIESMLEFFRIYGDKYHHYKEEQVLFPAMIMKKEVLHNKALKELIDNHDDFRDMLGNVETFLNRSDFVEASRQLHIYSANLISHVFTENREVFQRLSGLLSQEELDNMYLRFIKIDLDLGVEEKLRLEALVSTLMVETNLLS
ncbi:MAG: hemerythrin domain-containing protein [Bacteroidia bacterium]